MALQNTSAERTDTVVGASRALRNDAETVLANTPFLLTRCSSDLRFRYVSDAYARMLGYRPEDLVGKNVVEVIGEMAFETILPHVKTVLSGHRVEYETLIHYKNIKPRLLHFFYTPDKDQFENVQGWIASIVDVTEQRNAEMRVAADLRDMTRLNELSNRLVRESSEHDKNMGAVVDTAIAVTGAVKGSLRLLDPSQGVLIIAAQRGFGEAYLNLFTAMPVEASTYAAAMKAGERVIIEDMRDSELLAGHPSKEVLLEAGVCAVTSTPLLASTGSLLGMVSTHFDRPHLPNQRELHLVDLLARQTADYLERRKAEEIAHTLIREVQHRSNNLLAIIQTIASHSLSRNRSLEEAKAVFEARLRALARATGQLTRTNWTGVDLSDIVHSELEPFYERTKVDGTSILLDPKQAQNFSLALHELATNAAKYGALSNGSGTIGVSWTTSILDGAVVLTFKWRETGGPPVAAPTRQGFGTVLLKAAFPGARVAYAGDGLSCEIDIKLDGGQANRA
jgi:PAS domain S-box-containing protein